MKSRLKRLSVIFVAGIVITAGTRTWNVQGATLRAGVNAAFSDILAEGSEATITETEKDSVTAPAEEIETSTEEKENETICGYTNLGIAKVSDYLNVRKEASEDAELAGKMPADAGCEILETVDGWYKIKSGKVTGYVKSDYIVTGEEAKALAEELKTTVATVTTETVYIREEPNTDCTILSIVTTDEELEVVGIENEDWVEVKLDDENGYVSSKYVTLSEELKKASLITTVKKSEDGASSGSNSSLVQTALSYVGGRYVWGGTSLTSGVDCSGFTMRIFGMYGISLPHSSRAQAGYGRSVSTSELKPGDLIFYGSGSISHVAIYIGNGQIVHASNSRDGIKVSNAFYRTPICCRRLL